MGEFSVEREARVTSWHEEDSIVLVFRERCCEHLECNRESLWLVMALASRLRLIICSLCPVLDFFFQFVPSLVLLVVIGLSVMI